jgi:hypothetical protein
MYQWQEVTWVATQGTEHSCSATAWYRAWIPTASDNPPAVQPKSCYGARHGWLLHCCLQSYVQEGNVYEDIFQHVNGGLREVTLRVTNPLRSYQWFLPVRPCMEPWELRDVEVAAHLHKCARDCRNVLLSTASGFHMAQGDLREPKCHGELSLQSVREGKRHFAAFQHHMEDLLKAIKSRGEPGADLWALLAVLLQGAAAVLELLCGWVGRREGEGGGGLTYA